MKKNKIFRVTIVTNHRTYDYSEVGFDINDEWVVITTSTGAKTLIKKSDVLSITYKEIV